jgi:hypothetical protein
MPDMDFVIESQNRLWGCRYGASYQGMKYDAETGGLKKFYGAYVNEIYCCKLGDFKNWQSYQGIASDSYAVTVGTDGYFTGAVTHLGYPIFFKENYMHKIYGNYPANYQVQTTACRGVQKGCAESIATVNEVLYYEARSGVVGYDGSLPQEISSALGDEVYDKAVAGYLGNKYYISMRDAEGAYHLFVYDTKKAAWHREDNAEVLAFCNCKGNLYFISVSGVDNIAAVLGERRRVSVGVVEHLLLRPIDRLAETVDEIKSEKIFDVMKAVVPTFKDPDEVNKLAAEAEEMKAAEARDNQ